MEPNRINLGLTPKKPNGNIDYAQITSMVVRLLVIDEKIDKIRRVLKRHQCESDDYLLNEYSLESLDNRLAKLTEKKIGWQESLNEK